LCYAVTVMANPEHLQVVHSGAAAISEWKALNPGVSLDLTGADLADAVLHGFDLSRSNLAGANLTGADLEDCDLSYADLTRADLTMARLSRARLVGVNLYRASFTAAGLVGTDFRRARFGFTCVSDCDLFGAIRLEDVKDTAPSSIGVDTLTRTLRSCGGRFPKPMRKLVCGAGMPLKSLNAFINALREAKYPTCFIAYGNPDEAFAKRLCNSLQKRGVVTWFFPHHAAVGNPTLEEERRARRGADRVLVVCSAAGLHQAGLLREIDETIQEDRLKLVPVLKDSKWRRPTYRIERDGRDLKPALLENVWADFNAKPHRTALAQMLRGLRHWRERTRRRSGASVRRRHRGGR